MFGVYNSTFSHENGTLKLGMHKNGSAVQYFRDSGEMHVEKVLTSLSGGLIISPVEPVNLPKEITRYLLVEFPPLLIGPGESSSVYLTFPLEIGVFIGTNGSHEVIDIFSSSRTKYSLYGSPKSGVICRWHRSRLFTAAPDGDPLKEGIMELNIQNTTPAWQEVTQGVFNAYGMRLYYGSRVAMAAKMTLLSRDVAETICFDRPLWPNMTKAIELYQARVPLPGIDRGVLPVPGADRSKYLMEWGYR
ncbi:MAG TPA: DUF432 domain-containing protein [Methanomicrobiales archaeon]|nr:DUF432 domain-containing protein [Methanomicrobiales archaeon]